ncbi:ABC transporter permease subunit [Shewanella amazonensis]|uniref:Phosphate ABC transporter, permease protein, putative n=1 Tax=Shewanella amazonensis (strain ATCC BAA-1098 / SB2B) TaxID=326297 RepID=A1S5F9_SHEAM|nr:ABC transporter permease subunit [Shewanella amazonensis]ABL99615.1 phosphate ABC transporter, permease protein, putative [Shewanella amazonensis SB2B]
MEIQVTKPEMAASSILAGRGTGRRALKDKATAIGVSVGGVMVFVALLLIFFYLLYVVKPIFDSAEVTERVSVAYDASTAPALMVGSDEQNEILYRVATDGSVAFYRVSGELADTFVPTFPDGVSVSGAYAGMPYEQSYALGLSNGELRLYRVEFGVTYPDNRRLITPKLRQLSQDGEILVSESGDAIAQFAYARSSEQVSVAYKDAEGRWQLTRLEGEVNMMTEEVEWSRVSAPLVDAPSRVDQQLMTPDQRQLMLRGGNKIFVYDIRDAESPSLLQVIDAGRAKQQLTSVSLLAGASSLLLSYDSGDVVQYFQVSSDKGRLYREIRDFNGLGNIQAIGSEFYRKSFATITADGRLALLYTTSERELLSETFDIAKPQALGFSPRANGLVVDAGNKLHLFDVSNSHPEVSWSALWNKVWYEGYPEPKFVWQSTSGSDDFEAKLSLMPLAFGTMKAALYAMLFAVPIAIAGAIYTAYFMSPKVRGIVKPTIEIMEALPTVILGFLAGLWLAPLVEEHLPGILALLILLPVSILLSAYGWSKLPGRWKQRLPETYQELMLVPVICAVGYLSFAISPSIEVMFFHGDTRQFITNELGITFDQRNALVVGIAMGFAVIPTIFSIAEDAIFSVPRHLSNGSLALGATTWQTLTRVVLLTASPGIFSAIMMGLGRAVGETMIVLMATGNTAIMEWSVFEGMRTLAANIAVEMPESAIGSSHYRVLFLAAFVLFIFTFIFNTIAEVVRQRLRERYSSL